MNFIFLSPDFPDNFQYFVKSLNKAGINVLGISDKPWENLSSDLKSSLTEYYRVWSLDNYDELLRACGFFTHRYGKIDYIESLNEHWLATEAALRTDFNVSGIKNDTIELIKRKSAMKEVFKTAGASVALGCRAETEQDLRHFALQTGYPLVAKPDSGVGATSTYKINNDEELENFIKNNDLKHYFVEEFVEGQIHSYDGLTGENGEIVFETSHIFSLGVMETVNFDRDLYYYSTRGIASDLLEIGRAVVKAFGISKRFFHIEFFRTPENRLVALEVNMRPPGGLTSDMFNYANDISIYDMYAAVIAGHATEKKTEYPYHCVYVARKNGRPYRHTHEEIKDRFGENLVHFQPISGIFRNALGDWGYLLRFEDTDSVFEGAHYIQEKN
ncbi:ATP-grasp domain-containing protein [Myxococcota bacterium]|nr:ATP-grasp domain-containing protein [Myxococcota bacterium]MBU1379287.1 ATP-grasp domain-containing protein [Myxococcota bacterium]MBU1499023.1 ATP-grasp domain-containing protein [Myxococcota bacterium]